jgi:hypothetical protein
MDLSQKWLVPIRFSLTFLTHRGSLKNKATDLLLSCLSILRVRPLHCQYYLLFPSFLLAPWNTLCEPFFSIQLRNSELLGFWALSIVRYSKYTRKHDVSETSSLRTKSRIPVILSVVRPFQFYQLSTCVTPPHAAFFLISCSDFSSILKRAKFRIVLLIRQADL